MLHPSVARQSCLVLALLLSGCTGGLNKYQPEALDRNGGSLDAGNFYQQLHYWPHPEATDDDGQSCRPESLISIDEPSSQAEDNLWSRLTMGYSIGQDNVDEQRIDKQMSVYANQQQLFDVVGVRASRYLLYVMEKLEERDMPLELALLPFVESGYNPRAVSSSQAVGMWQVIASTGKNIGLDQNQWYDGRKDVMASTDAVLDYLSALYKRFDNDWYLALAAYNAGEGSVQRAIDHNRRLGKPTDYWSLPLSQQACNYVPRLIALTRLLEDPEEHGVELPALSSEPTVVPVEVSRQISLQRAATLAGMDSAELFKLNPAYKSGFTPPNSSATVMVPVEDKQNFLAAVDLLPARPASHAERYRIRSGDSLLSVARLYRTTPEALRTLNGLPNDDIKAGDHLLIPRDAILPERSFRTSDGTERRPQGVYTVRPGDSLWIVARRSGIPLKQLMRLNGMTPTSVLRVGQQLNLRVSVTAPLPAQELSAADGSKRKIDYRVQNGDSLYRIAGRFKLALTELMRWNDIDANRPLIHPGQMLVLYLDEAGPS